MHFINKLELRRCFDIVACTCWLSTDSLSMPKAPSSWRKLLLEEFVSSHGLNNHLQHRACCLGCLQGASESVQVRLNDIESVLVLTLIILKQQVL